MAEGGAGTVALERQNTEDVADLPLQIPVAAVYEHFQCPICMSTMVQACITTCGHRFCYKCIEECINRRHQCPCCKTALDKEDIINDHSFDALMRSVRDERKKSMKDYYQKLVEAATNGPFEEGASSSVESPLETVLKKHLKHTLNMHEMFHQQLVMDYQRGLGKIAQEKQMLTERIMRNFPHDPDHPDRLSQLAEIERRGEEKKEVLAGELERTEKLLSSAYDKYLTNYLPSPSTIPVTVSLSVPERKFLAPEVVLRPDDNMAAVLRKLRLAMEERGMMVAEFPACEEFTISIISPFAPTNEGSGVEDEELEVEAEGASNGHHGSKAAALGGIKGRMNLLDQVLHPDCRPVLEFSLKPGTELRFKGSIILEGETPSQCFAATFVKGQSRSIDYFTCKDCGFNWVCQPCAEICHKGHTLVPYVRNHKPTWACCYCPKKKKCGIQQKLST